MVFNTFRLVRLPFLLFLVCNSTLVKNKLEDGAYNDIVSFERDVKLVFENAILFNGKDSDVGRMAAELMNIFLPVIKNAKETPGSTSI